RLVVVEGDPGRQHLSGAGEQLGVGQDPPPRTSGMGWGGGRPLSAVPGPRERPTSSSGAAIDPERARAQHAAYRDALADLVEVVVLPPDDELPDACFVDDCAVVLGGQALLTRPGAPSRAAEPETLAATLAGLVDDLHHMTAPATLDGGDVLRLGRTLVAGRSRRTSQGGVHPLTGLAAAGGAAG